MPTRPSPPPLGATTRRTAVGAALAGLAVLPGVLSACDEGRGGDTPASGVSTAIDADAGLVSDLVDEIGALALLVDATGRAHRRLAAPMRSLHALHLAHLDVLGAEPPTGTTHRSRGDDDAALREVTRREQHLQSRLVGDAVSARSGQLARVLACMSAGVAQRVALLPKADAR